MELITELSVIKNKAKAVEDMEFIKTCNVSMELADALYEIAEKSNEDLGLRTLLDIRRTALDAIERARNVIGDKKYA